MLKTWMAETADGRPVAYAEISGFQHWVICGSEDRAVRGLRYILCLHGRADLVPQLGLSDQEPVSC